MCTRCNVCAIMTVLMRPPTPLCALHFIIFIGDRLQHTRIALQKPGENIARASARARVCVHLETYPTCTCFFFLFGARGGGFHTVDRRRRDTCLSSLPSLWSPSSAARKTAAYNTITTAGRRCGRPERTPQGRCVRERDGTGSFVKRRKKKKGGVRASARLFVCIEMR